MAKEFLVKGAKCMCKFGASPGMFTVLDNTYFKVNGNKLAGTTLSLGNTFDPPGFAVCRVNPLYPKPCTPAITKWSMPFTGIKNSAGANPLTEQSTATCATGAPECISVIHTGQIPIPGVADFMKATYEYQPDLDPVGVPMGLTGYQIPFDIESNFMSFAGESEKKDEKFEIKIVHVTKGEFVPLGIPNKVKEKQGIADKIKIAFKIRHSEAKEYTIQIKDADGNIVYTMCFLPEIVVTAKGEPSDEDGRGYKPGEYIFEWDGFDHDDIYDTAKLKGKYTVEVSGVGTNGKESSDQTTIQWDKMAVKWMDVKINKKSKQIDVLLRVELRDKGDTGLKSAKKVPDSVITEKGYDPITNRTRSFDELKQLFFDGVKKYWSRKVTIGEEEYHVQTVAIHTTKKCMDDLGLRYVTNESPGRSGNPGSATSNPYTWVANFAYQRVYYNVGYLNFSDGWGYNSENYADRRFKETGAHEMGHEILKEFGGATYSYEHKGTSTMLQKPVKGTRYPSSPQEIDLMKYYDESMPSDFFSRVVAMEEDVLGMLWLSKIKVK